MTILAAEMFKNAVGKLMMVLSSLAFFQNLIYANRAFFRHSPRQEIEHFCRKLHFCSMDELMKKFVTLSGSIVSF